MQETKIGKQGKNQPKPNLAAALPYVVLLGFLFGSGIVVSRFSIGQFNPFAFAAVRLLLAALIHALSYVILKRRPFPRDPYLWLHGSIAGIIGTGLPTIALLAAVRFNSSGLTSLLITLNLATTVILAHFFLENEHLSLNKVIGILIAFSGAALLLLRGETGLAEISQADWRGYAWTGLIVLGLSGGAVYTRRFLHAADSYDASSVRMFASAIVFVPAVWILTGMDFSDVRLSGLGALFYTTVFATFLAFMLHFYITKRFGATSVSQFSYVTPIAATVLGAILLGEIITPAMLLGMVLIFSGLALLGWKVKK
jgi:drug/metabolite transporter (DMT)-like permease